MYQGQCAFSGLMVPRGSGLHKVGNDNKVVFAWGKREHNYIEKKISPRSVKWTEGSRAFFNKTHKDTGDKSEFIPITKIVRGFAHIPKSLIADTQETAKPAEGRHSAVGKKGEKVFKNSNMKASGFRK